MLFKKKSVKKVEEKKKEQSQVQEVPPAIKLTKISSRVLLKPIITEKATALATQNKYLFAVARETNKIEIKKAIKELYNFWPVKVNIIKMRGKEVRYGQTRGQTKKWIKAIVTLKKGEKIDLGLTT